MSRIDCIEETISESLDEFGIKLTKDQLESLSNNLDVSIDMYDELSSYRYDYSNPYEVKAKELQKQVNEMYSKDAYKNLEDKLNDHKREIHRLHKYIDDLKRQLQIN